MAPPALHTPDGAVAPGAQRPVWQVFLLFLAPMLLTNLLQALAGTINAIYIGQLLGVRALGAVAAFLPVLAFFVAFVIGLGSGASIVIGQAWGARDLDRVRAVAGTVISAGALLAGAVGVAGFVLAAPILRLLGTPADVLPDAIAYARVMMLFLPLLFLSILAAAVLRGVSDTVTPLLSLLISTGGVLLLTPALIAGRAGFPALGVTGGAWATMLAMALSLAWMVWHLRRRAHPLAPDSTSRTHWRIQPRLLRPVLRLGLPTSLFFVLSSLADLGLVGLVNRHGSAATAAWGAVNQALSYAQFPAMSISITAAILAAQAIGAGQFERVRSVMRAAVQMNLAIVGGMSVAVALFAPQIAALFITDPQVAGVAATLLRIGVWAALLLGTGSIFSGIMRAGGTVLVPTAISLSLLAFVLFPLGWAFDSRFGLAGIRLAYPLTFGIGCLLQVAYFHGVWKKRPLRRLT